MAKLWGSRFSGVTDALMKQLNDSISFDIRLWDADIRGSIAYAGALARAGIITRREAARLVGGLRKVHAEFKRGRVRGASPTTRTSTPRSSGG